MAIFALLVYQVVEDLHLLYAGLEIIFCDNKFHLEINLESVRVTA